MHDKLVSSSFIQTLLYSTYSVSGFFLLTLSMKLISVPAYSISLSFSLLCNILLHKYTPYLFYCWKTLELFSVWGYYKSFHWYGGMFMVNISIHLLETCTQDWSCWNAGLWKISFHIHSQFSKVMMPFHTPINSVFSATCSIPAILMVSQCGFTLPLLIDYGREHLFNNILIAHVNIFFCRGSIPVFSPFFFQSGCLTFFLLTIYLGHIADLVPGHRNKMNAALKQVTWNFWFPSASKSCLYYTGVY